jgi:CRP/FNR family transcriptional regulator
MQSSKPKSVEIIKLKAGEVVFHEDDKGNEMYVIRSGKIEISKQIDGKKVVLAVFNKGNFFGEMCLFGEPRRTAAAIVLEDCVLVVITKRILDSQLRKVPQWFLEMFKAIIDRLRKTDILLKEKIEKKNT